MKTETIFRAGLALMLASTPALSGQTFSTISSFSGGNGANPQAGLVSSGNLYYGTTSSGGTSNAGTVFSVNTNGTITTLYSFKGAVYNSQTHTYNPADGENPIGALVLSSNMLYGTTSGGGAAASGTIFSVNTNGSNYSVLYSFSGGYDGAYPEAGLVLVSNTLYGTAFAGGLSGIGDVFRINTNGTHFTNINSFAGGTNGSNPESRLIAAGNTLFGTTYGPFYSGTGHGTVFMVNFDGTGFSNIYDFTGGSDGAFPEAGLILSGSTLYGTTGFGGDYSGLSGDGAVFAVNTNGTGFHAYPLNYGTAANPQAELTLVGAKLYGTAANGGTQGYGALFQIGTNGTGLTNVYSFLDSSDGASPEAPLTYSNGVLYGTTQANDAYDFGTVFALTIPGSYPPLNITLSGNQATISWTGSGYSLQAASSLPGNFTTVTNSSPYTTTVTTNSQMFYHLH